MTIVSIEKGSQRVEDQALRILAELERRGYPPMCTQKHVGEITQLKDSSLEQDRVKGFLGIPFCRLGRSIRYPLDGIAGYLASLQRCTSTSEVKEVRQCRE